MKKKFFAFMLVLTLLAMPFTSLASGDGAAVPAEDLDTLTVGTPEMNGDFIYGFGNSSYDRYIKDLVTGHMTTYATTPAGKLVLNETVVENLDVSTDDEGNKTYTYKIHEDLKFSNGDPITAKDFAASALFSASPEWEAAGASTSAFDSLVGYDDYKRGYLVDEEGLAVDADGNTIEVETEVPETDEDGNEVKDEDGNVKMTTKTNLDEIRDQVVPVKNFKGVQLIDEYTIAVTIQAEKLPYFYETSYASIGPIYMPTYTPDAEVSSDEENGVSFQEGYDLAAACVAVAENERFAPTVTVGPYRFVSFENQIVTLELNEHFKGNFEGKKPTIKNIVQKAIPQNTDVDSLIAGDVDLIMGVIQGAKIEKAKASENVNVHFYNRAGFGLLAFHMDFGITADQNVRWALAHMIDRQAVVDHVLEGYGGLVDSLYGLAQWMYQERADELDEELEPISLNLDMANEFLDNSPYRFEADGTTPFDVSKVTEDGSYLRHDENGEEMVLRHLGTTENPITDIIEIEYMKNAPMCGLKFEVTKSDFNALLDNYYYGFELGDDRIYNSFNLATNFNPIYDPYYSFHSEFLGTWRNAYQMNDPEVDRITVAMRELEPTQTEEFADYWVELMVRFQELMPLVPLYSNEYYDLSYKTVDNLNTTPYADYSSVIFDITKSAK